MNKTDRIKKHFSDNKKLYVGVGIGAGVVLAGITCVKMRTHTPLPCSTKDTLGSAAKALPQGHSNAAKALPQGHSISNLHNSVGINNGIINVVEREGRGHPGYMVKCVENGLTYMSQKAAAMDLDLNEVRLSQHLNGVRDQVGGYTFERIVPAA